MAAVQCMTGSNSDVLGRRQSSGHGQHALLLQIWRSLHNGFGICSLTSIQTQTARQTDRWTDRHSDRNIYKFALLPLSYIEEINPNLSEQLGVTGYI